MCLKKKSSHFEIFFYSPMKRNPREDSVDPGAGRRFKSSWTQAKTHRVLSTQGGKLMSHCHCHILACPGRDGAGPHWSHPTSYALWPGWSGPCSGCLNILLLQRNKAKLNSTPTELSSWGKRQSHRLVLSWRRKSRFLHSAGPKVTFSLFLATHTGNCPVLPC